MLNNSIINSMQVVNIERVVCTCKILIERARKERMPCVVTEVNDALTGRDQLSDEVVFFNCRARKVRAAIDEDRECAGC